MAEATEDDTAARKCHLLELPAELRNDIYEMVVADDGTAFASLHIPDSRATFMQPALTRASRQLREEALPIYYAQNSFRVNLDRSIKDGDDQFESFESWILGLGDKSKQLMHLELNLCNVHACIVKLYREADEAMRVTFVGTPDARFCYGGWLKHGGSQAVERVITNANKYGLSGWDVLNLVKSWDQYQGFE